MKKLNIEDAIGKALCHDVTAVRDGFKGALFKRGHIISNEDIKEFLNIGKRTVFVWEEGAGEIHEEDAAIRMSKMAECKNAHYSEPSEGKVVLFSDLKGMFRVNRELLREINSIGDITILSIPDHYPVIEGERLASMRIIPLVTKEENIIKAENLCKNKELFKLLPYNYLKVGIIITGSEVYSGRIKDKFEPVIREKLKKYPCDIIGVSICDDNLSMIVDSAKGFIEKGADLIIFTGGMSVDPDDLTPSAIREVGAEIVSYGIPAQPGNMTLVGYKGDTAMVGVPSAAISLPVTALDVLLPQIFAKVRFTKEELINLGEGGLCQFCKECHFPNCTFGRY